MVLPTRNEAFGLVLLEAMAAGRPVISTRVGGPEEIVVDGESGLLVPRDDASGLSSALRAVLDDPALAARLATGGRSRVEAEFSDTAVTARTVGIYEDVLAKRRIRAA
jgi:glycosyltransferase involved in cell wall biosynthesis